MYVSPIYYRLSELFDFRSSFMLESSLPVQLASQLLQLDRVVAIVWLPLCLASYQQLICMSTGRYIVGWCCNTTDIWVADYQTSLMLVFFSEHMQEKGGQPTSQVTVQLAQSEPSNLPLPVGSVSQLASYLCNATTHSSITNIAFNPMSVKLEKHLTKTIFPAEQSASYLASYRFCCKFT